MSFFEEDDATRRQTPVRPRRSGSGGSRRPPSDDHQAVLVRRGVALGGGVLLLVLVLLLVSSCRSSARENALKDYNAEVTSVAQDSVSEVAEPFFGLFSGSAGRSPTDLQTSVASLRQESERQLDRAEGLSVPSQMVPAQRSLLIVLELRRDGLDFIAERIRAALGDDDDAAADAAAAIAGQMQSFLASDVLYRTRVQPLIAQALRDEEIGAQRIVDSRFLPNVGWLDARTVADRVGGGGGASDGGDGGDDEPAPGTHGTGLQGVSVGDVTLQPDAANRIPLSGGAPTFTVSFTNQGENDEEDVRVAVRVRAGGRTIGGSGTVDTIAQGATAEATVRLSAAPPTGTTATISVEVRAVPGEEKTDNNEQEYPALFEG